MKDASAKKDSRSLGCKKIADHRDDICRKNACIAILIHATNRSKHRSFQRIWDSVEAFDSLMFLG